MKIALLTGGTGGVKVLLGLLEVVPLEDLYVIVNTGDDFIWNGLYISPDLDSVIYALTGMLDLDKMWGIRDDTFNFLKQAELFGLENTWFKIGDKDLVIHVLRTSLLRKGYKLSDFCDYVCSRFKLPPNITPMTDHKVRTMILTELGELNIQEFLVKYSKKLTPIAIRYRGIENAKATSKAIYFLQKCDIIIIGPSSPPVSILPILKVKPIGKLLRSLNKPKICILPMIKDRPISGITDKLLRALGYEGKSIDVVKIYEKYGITHVVCDKSDDEVVQYLEKSNIKTIVTNIVINSVEDSKRLIEKIINEI